MYITEIAQTAARKIADLLNDDPTLTSRLGLTQNERLEFIETFRFKLDETDPFLSTSEVARVLGVHRNTIIAAFKKGRIKGVQYTPGGHARVKMSDLKVYMAANNLVPVELEESVTG